MIRLLVLYTPWGYTLPSPIIALFRRGCQCTTYSDFIRIFVFFRKFSLFSNFQTIRIFVFFNVHFSRFLTFAGVVHVIERMFQVPAGQVTPPPISTFPIHPAFPSPSFCTNARLVNTRDSAFIYNVLARPRGCRRNTGLPLPATTKYTYIAP